MIGFVQRGGRWEIDKDPDARLLYGIDLSPWLGGDSVATLETQVVGVEVESSFMDGNVAKAWVVGGTENQPASVTFRFTTAGGSIDDRTLHFNMVHR